MIFGGSVAVMAGVVVALAPMAQAEPTPCGRYYCPCDEVFRTPTAPDAWTSSHPVVFSPYGTARIYCHSEPGFFDAWQLDPAGQEHQLYSLQAISSGAQGKVYVFNNYVIPGPGQHH